MNANFIPKADLRDLVYLYNGLLFFKQKAPMYDLAGWQKSFSAIFPEVELLKSWQLFYHAKPLVALNQLNMSIAADTTQGSGMMGVLAFWKYATAFPVKTPPITRVNAVSILEKYPFQIPVLQQALPLVPTKKGYEYALAALQWNEQNPAYYPIYAFQALKMGEITYADEAMDKLKSLDPALYQTQQASYLAEKQRAQQKTKF
jgi:hypothetical protein